MLGKIGNLLERLKKITPPNYILRTTTSEAIEDILGIKLDIKNIKVSNSCIYLDVKQIIKNEVFLHKQKILKAIIEKSGKNIDNIL